MRGRVGGGVSKCTACLYRLVFHTLSGLAHREALEALQMPFTCVESVRRAASTGKLPGHHITPGGTSAQQLEVAAPSAQPRWRW
jgi:hypothetical protein